MILMELVRTPGKSRKYGPKVSNHMRSIFLFLPFVALTNVNRITKWHITPKSVKNKTIWAEWFKTPPCLSQLLAWDTEQHLTHPQWHNYTMCASLVSVSQNLKHHCFVDVPTAHAADCWWLMSMSHTQSLLLQNTTATGNMRVPGFTQCLLLYHFITYRFACLLLYKM